MIKILMRKILYEIFCFRLNGLLNIFCRLGGRSVNSKKKFNLILFVDCFFSEIDFVFHYRSSIFENNERSEFGGLNFDFFSQCFSFLFYKRRQTSLSNSKIVKVTKP